MGMKLNFNWAEDGQVHTYCVVCHGEHMEVRQIEGKTQYYCADCQKIYDRWIKIDPGLTWWVAEDDEYWHESSGIFVRNAEGKFLFFQRTIFPFSMTVPAGHVDSGEIPIVAARRELEEEVGLEGELVSIADEPIVGDSCSRGSDAHVWHAFLVTLPDTPTIEVREEGEAPIWMTLDEALAKDVIVPVRFMIEHYKDQLTA